MATRPRKGSEITPVDDEFRGQQVQDHPERGRIEALFDQNLFRLQLRRERSAAFWMAASIWGTSGLILGAFLGAYMMYMAMGSSLPLASEAVTRGMAVEQARTRADENPLTLHDQQSPQQQPQSNR